MSKQFIEITGHAKADEARQGRVKINGVGESAWCDEHSRWYFTEYGCIMCEMDQLPNFPDYDQLKTRASRIMDGYYKNPMQMAYVISYLEKGMFEQKQEIDSAKDDAARLSDVLRETLNALNCSPLTPWDRCENPSIQNNKHFCYHVREIIDMIGAELVRHDRETKPNDTSQS